MVARKRATLQVTLALLGMFRRKYDQSRRSHKMSPKEPKLKVIMHTFRISRGPSSERHRMPHRDMGGH